MSFAPSPVDPERSRKWPAAAGLKTAVIVGGIDMMTQAGLPVLHMLTHACNVLRRSGTTTCTWPVHVDALGRFHPQRGSGARTGGYARKKAARDRRHAWPSD